MRIVIVDEGTWRRKVFGAFVDFLAAHVGDDKTAIWMHHNHAGLIKQPCSDLCATRRSTARWARAYTALNLGRRMIKTYKVGAAAVDGQPRWRDTQACDDRLTRRTGVERAPLDRRVL